MKWKTSKNLTISWCTTLKGGSQLLCMGHYRLALFSMIMILILADRLIIINQKKKNDTICPIQDQTVSGSNTWFWWLIVTLVIDVYQARSIGWKYILHIVRDCFFTLIELRYVEFFLFLNYRNRRFCNWLRLPNLPLNSSRWKQQNL